MGVHGFNPAGAVGSGGLAAAPTLPQCRGHGDKPGDTRVAPQGVMGQVTPVPFRLQELPGTLCRYCWCWSSA